MIMTNDDTAWLSSWVPDQKRHSVLPIKTTCLFTEKVQESILGVGRANRAVLQLRQFIMEVLALMWDEGMLDVT